MVAITRKVDQAVFIGQAIRVAPTDVDRAGVRLLAEGGYVGGPRDGARFRSTHEVAKGGSIQLGAVVTITVVDLFEDSVRLGILAPPNLPITSG